MRGPCAKRRVQCVLMLPGLAPIMGENDCANPQKACPRKDGEDYTKCKTICRQSGHAETEALREASRLGVEVAGWRAYIRGHYWMCEPCGRALRDAGITKITIVHDEGSPSD